MPQKWLIWEATIEAAASAYLPLDLLGNPPITTANIYSISMSSPGHMPTTQHLGGEKRITLLFLPWLSRLLELLSPREGVCMLGGLTDTYLTNAHFRSFCRVAVCYWNAQPISFHSPWCWDFLLLNNCCCFFFLSISPHVTMAVSLPGLQGPVWVSLLPLLLEEPSYDFSFLGIMYSLNQS